MRYNAALDADESTNYNEDDGYVLYSDDGVTVEDLAAGAGINLDDYYRDYVE